MQDRTDATGRDPDRNAARDRAQGPFRPWRGEDAPKPGEAPATFHWPVTVYYEDTDAGGIVYYANYLRFFERARTEWLRALGVSHRDAAEQDGIQFVVRDLRVAYDLPARLDDRLTMHLNVTAVRRASLVLHQWATRTGSESVVLVEADVRIAAVRRDNGRPAALPSRLLSRISA